MGIPAHRFEDALALLLSALTLALCAQNPPILPQSAEKARLHPTWKTPDAAQRQQAHSTHRALEAQSPFKMISFKCVGPMAQGGRVMAMAMDDRQPETWMAAFATGGLWITHTDGRTWESLFDHQESFAIGDIAVTWGKPGVPKTIWVGTGEASNTRTVYMGAGLFRSDDQGKTWQKVALGNSHHIGRVMVHPKNPDTVFVAALGPVYTEGGATFTRLAGGLPNGEYLGRIGLAQSRQDSKKLYAIVDNQTPRPLGPRNPERISATAFQAMSQEDFLKLEDERMERFLSVFGFPEDFKVDKVRKAWPSVFRLQELAGCIYPTGCHRLRFDRLRQRR